MTIARKLSLGFGLVLSLTIAVGSFGLWNLARVRETTSALSERDFRALDLLRTIGASQDEMKILRERALSENLLQRRGFVDRDPALLQEQWRRSRDRTAELLSRLASLAGEYEASPLTLERAVQWRKVREAVEGAQKDFAELSDEIEAQFAMLNRNELAELARRRSELDRLRQAFDARIDTGASLVEEAVGLGTEAANRSFGTAWTSILVALAGAVVVASFAAVSIQRSIVRPLGEFARFAERVGQGDLTQRAVSTNRDELGHLGATLNEMVAGLAELTGQAHTAATKLSSATSEILASTQQQVAVMSEQSAAVQQTSSTMQEIAESATQVAERAKAVSARADAVASRSELALEAVRGMADAMEGIRAQAQVVAENIVSVSEKTQAVGEIISAVNDIAEQSHLLALNAAIEAAAAGESGRSFSVVAQEMKNLADQAKEATKQVQTILSDVQRGIHTSVMLTEEAVKRVESGKERADIVRGNIEEMGAGIQESVRAFQQIVASTNQQRIGFEQVSQALKSITQAIEQAAAGNRQLEEAAAHLSALGEQMRATVERYRV